MSKTKGAQHRKLYTAAAGPVGVMSNEVIHRIRLYSIEILSVFLFILIFLKAAANKTDCVCAHHKTKHPGNKFISTPFFSG
jgi:hypothetical protein